METQIRVAGAEHAQSRRFLDRVSWAIVLVLGAMAIDMWGAPYAQHAKLPRLLAAIQITFLLEFFALIALVVLLRMRLASNLRRDAAQQAVLTQQNERLTGQNDELAQQTELLQEQAVELEGYAAELENRALELNRANGVLQESERRQHALADELRLLTRRLGAGQKAAHLGYWEIDYGSGAKFWSHEMYDLWGVPRRAAPPSMADVVDFLHPEDQQRFRRVMKRALTERVEFTELYRLIRPDGEVRTLQAQGRVVVEGDGPGKLIGTVQDVTDRMQLETQLRQAQKMDAIGKLAGGVAHDFNNILTVIEGYANLLASAGTLEGADRDAIKEILEASHRAAALTRQLLAFSRQQVLQPRLLDVNEAIAGVERMLRRLIGENIEFVTKMQPSIDMVMADPGQVEQVLLNLAVNARDAMPHGGVLEIETANVVLGETDAKNHRVRTPGPHVMLSVTDTGSGIAPELLDRIFEPFFTTKESGKGTGLGLATVHGIVQQSGGHCSVASEPGRGTTFSVYLPSRAGERDVAGESGQEDRPTLHGDETILFVEDDSSLRTMACAVLRGAGYEVIEASDGLEALRLCGDASVEMDLVISDMVMPVMDGRDLATHVQRLRPGVRTLLMSGYTRDALVHNPDQNPAAWFLEKPFTPDALQRKVREVLDRPNTPEAA